MNEILCMRDLQRGHSSTSISSTRAISLAKSGRPIFCLMLLWPNLSFSATICLRSLEFGPKKP